MKDPRLPIRSAFLLTAIAASLLLATLACQIDVGGPELPGEPIPVSTEAAKQMTRAWESALASAAGTRSLAILLNETQVTSVVALRLDADESPILSSPQVFLREGRIQVYGITQRGPLQASVLVTVEPRLNPDGSVSFEVTSADFGPFPVPDAVRESVSAMLTDAFTTPLGSLATGIQITSLVVADGQVAIIGELR